MTGCGLDHLRRSAERAAGDPDTPRERSRADRNAHLSARPRGGRPRRSRPRTDLQSVGCVDATRHHVSGPKAGTVEHHRRYFITSLPARVAPFAHAVRSHWQIENACHWTLDVVFNEDQHRARRDAGPANLATLRIAVPATETNLQCVCPVTGAAFHRREQRGFHLSPRPSVARTAGR
ncbi:MAG: ISAs1 family transposase [Gemmatimonadaceae bacterium]